VWWLANWVADNLSLRYPVLQMGKSTRGLQSAASMSVNE
jgi:hypothetical protein